MGIIIKFILRNICEKKFRTFLIVLSIVLSSALFFASAAISDTMAQMRIDRMKQFFGSSDIVIHSREKSPSPFFNIEAAGFLRERAQYIIGAVQGSASFKFGDNEAVNVSLLGINLEDLQAFNPIAIYEDQSLLPFEGNKIILSKTTIEKYGFNLGEFIELDISGIKYKMKICGVSYPSGPFSDESQGSYAAVPKNTLSSIYNYKGKVSIAYIKMKDPLEKLQAIAQLSGQYSQYTVREPISREDIKRNTQSTSTAFQLMAVIVTIMSVFIIYTSFKVIALERLPVIGTFRSLGATRKTTNFVLLLESSAYGVLGGLLGCGLGYLILFIMAVLIRPRWMSGYKVAVNFSPAQMLAAFIFAILLSLASCIIPIIRVSKIPVKDIILNAMDKKIRVRAWKYVLGLFFLLVSLTAPPLAPRHFAFAVDSACMLFSVIGIILLVPLLTGIFVTLFEKLYLYIFGNIGSLAAKNLRENKSILNNISLLSIGISSLLMINTISHSVMLELTSFYRSANFDIWIMSMGGADRNFDRLALKLDGIDGIYGVFESYNVEIPDRKGERISLVQGVDKGKFFDYWDFDTREDRSTILEELDSGRNIILTSSLKEKLGVQKGDSITLKLKQGNKSYKIIGFVNTLRNNGGIALVSERYLKYDSGAKYYSNIFIKTSNEPDDVVAVLNKEFGKRRPFMWTVSYMENLEQKSNEDMFMILKGFSLLALVIGIFGVLNNLIISFIERKRSLAMYRSLGMDKEQIMRMLFIEAFTGGIIGGVIGVGAGFLMIWGVPYVLKAIDMFIPIHYPFDTIGYYLLAGIIIVVAASLSPAVKSSRLNIIDAIKYE